MADRGITFSAAMVRALLAGTKTQTRRLMSPQPVWEPEKFDGFTFAAGWTADKLGLSRWQDSDEFRQHLLTLVRHQPGDRIYVREHWRAECNFDDTAPRDLTPDGVQWRYEADGAWSDRDPMTAAPGRHRQAMHMPRWASRLTLLVTDVRVQRLQDISEEDAAAEGVCAAFEVDQIAHGKSAFGDISSEDRLAIVRCHFGDLRTAYHWLWNTLHTDPGTRWEDNPWIYAVTFDVRHGNIDQIGGEA